VDLDRTLRNLSFSSDGSELATGTADDVVELWNVETGADSRPLQGHTDAILALASSPMENLIATGSKDRTARLWDLATGAARTVTTESSAIVDLSFSGDGRRLLTRNADGKISVWNTKTGEPSGTLASSSRATGPSLTPNGRFIAVVDQHSVVTVDLDSNQKRLIPLTGSPSIAVAFDSTSSLAAIGDGAVPVIWDLATGTTKVRLGRKTMRPSSLGLSDDGIEAVAADDHVVTTWNVHTGAIRNLSSAVAIPAGTLLALSPDRSILAIHADVSIRDRVTTFLSTDDGHKLLSLEDAAGPPVLFSRTGRYFADIDRSGRLAVRTLDGTSVLDLSPPAGAISRLAFSDDDTSVALLETEGQIHVWRLPSARPSRPIRSQAKGTRLRFVSPSVLVKVQGGDPVESWNVETGMKMPAHPPTVPLERRELAALGTDNGIEIFDLDRSRYVRHLSLAGFSSIVAAQWSAKAGLLATASEDGEVTIWKEINGMAQRICGLYLYADCTPVVLTPEGSRLPDHRCVLPDDALNGGKDHHD
jgi:WD40 repeat protein